MASPASRRPVASVEVVTRNRADGEVEHVYRIKLWEKGKALEQLCRHLGLYQNQQPSEQSQGRPISDLTDEELSQRLLDQWAHWGPLIEAEAKRLRD